MMAEQYFCYQGLRNYDLTARFLSQPPEDLRKSNFFNFTIELRVGGELVEIISPRFINFINENNASEIRNGVQYSFCIRQPNGVIENRQLFLTLVDASTSQPIRYEGHDDNPKMQRVFLTHEAICTRCSLQKSCGNKNEAPSDPLIVSKGIMKFFLKCNQNCLKAAGNPRDMRRFAIAVSFEDITSDQSKIRAMSNKIFVHNNSKHNRKRKKEADSRHSGPPSTEIAYIHPRVGIKQSTFSFYSKEWSRNDVSFRCQEIELPVTAIVPGVGLIVLIPYSLPSGRCIITVYVDHLAMFNFPYDVYERYHSEIKPPLLGFLCLHRRARIDHEINLGLNNYLAFITEPPEYPLPFCFDNNSSPLNLNYSPNQSYSFSSSTTSPSSGSSGTTLSGSSDSSPPYYPSGY